ncbi:MAG TPA: DUF2007 domain-containing protein [Chitinophagaceae bacterium]|jgi:hypothetical protein|nr:DUF2007 domain-containing protein [Chitinophagaceae bacterium]
MNFVCIRAYDNYIKANLELSLLRQAGINCHLKDEYTVTIDPLLSPALGGMKLMVEEENRDQAFGILEESDRFYLKSVPCPRCRHYTLEMITETTQYKSLGGRIKSLLINGQAERVKKFYRCENCSFTAGELPEGV